MKGKDVMISDASNRFQHHFDRGDYFREQGNIREAVLEYKEALHQATEHQDPNRQDPDFSLTLSKLIMALEDNGELDEALLIGHELLRLTPEDAFAHEMMGNIFAAKGDFNQAIPCYQEALRLDPDVDNHYNLAVRLKEAGRFHEAVATYRKALRLAPNEPDIHYSLGNALRQLDRLEEAVGEYQTAIRIKPDYADAYNNLGLTLNDLGRHEEAASACRHGLDFVPGDAELQLNLQDALDGQEESA